jgi:predicted dinucleotide-binding enzyme
MKIAVIGAGNVGGTLAKAWAKIGHQVLIGVRDAASPKVQALVRSLPANASIDTIANACAFGEVVLLAVPGSAVEEVVESQAKKLVGKIVIDAANRMGAPEMNSAAILAAKAPSARVFRAFNSAGWEVFANPRFGDTPADLFYCGPEGSAQRIVEGLIADIGLHPVRVGTLEQVKLVDAIGALWINQAFGQKMGRQFAFKLLTR